MSDLAELIERLEGGDPVYDKHGIPILVGDVLKVFHFIGARRKRHYMYKQVVGVMTLGTPPHTGKYLKIDHLSMDPSEYYTQRLDGSILDDYEIVQSRGCDHTDRPRTIRALHEKGRG